MKTADLIKQLEKKIGDQSSGLPYEIFLFVSRLTPLINVDLLIKDENGRTLLAWRDDKYAGTGWHIPGGIIRHREKIETRIKKVIETEVDLPVKYEDKPMKIIEFIKKRKTRGHFITLVFKCFLLSKYVLNKNGTKEREVGFLKWHKGCPDDLIKCHEKYRKFLENKE